MTECALKSGRESEFLQRIKRSLAAAYDEVREAATLIEGEPPVFDMKVFTDDIVVAYPLLEPGRDLGEPELVTLLDLFAHVQARLSADGFFLRGAITAGRHYQDQDIAYGEALLEAVDLNESGKPPRLVIGSSTERLIAEHLSWYGGGWAPHHDQLLEDSCDGQLFVNYLKVAYENFPDGPIDYPFLAAHGKRVHRNLRAYEPDTRERQKYEWIATYHNYVCQTLAEQIGEARPALDHLVSIENLDPQQPPRPLDAQRLRQRVTMD